MLMKGTIFLKENQAAFNLGSDVSLEYFPISRLARLTKHTLLWLIVEKGEAWVNFFNSINGD